MIHVVRSGRGPLLVCLHGIGGSAATFDHQLGGLAADFEVMAYDAPGYGNSADPEHYPATRGYVDTVVEIIGQSENRRAYLLGMSWGGVVAMNVALSHPDLLAGLILGDSTRGSGQTPQQIAAMRARPRELADVGATEFARRRSERLLAPTADQAARQAASAAMAGSIRLPGYEYAARFMAETDLTGKLSAIDIPTLVLYGTEDVVTGRAESEAIAAEIPAATLRPIPDAGHLANQEQPTAFNNAVREFIHRVEGKHDQI